MSVLICKRCGVEIQRTGTNHVHCESCRKTVTCKRCGVKEERSGRNQSYCKSCGLVRKGELMTEWRKKHGIGLRLSMPCKRCGIEFEQQHSNQRYCEPCRLPANEERGKAWRDARKILPTCKRCGVEIERTGSRSSYCEPCRTIAASEVSKASYERRDLRTIVKQKHNLDETWARHYDTATRCDCCKKPFKGSKSRVSGKCIDHDHACCPGATSCGKCVRGIICPTCNRNLAALDNTTFMLNANAYLKRYDRIRHAEAG